MNIFLAVLVSISYFIICITIFQTTNPVLLAFFAIILAIITKNLIKYL